MGKTIGISDLVLFQVMSRMGIAATEKEAAELFALVDVDRDGRISVAEFARYIGGGGC